MLKFLKLCAIKLNLHNGTDLAVVGCYCPPLATAQATALLSDFLQNLRDIILYIVYCPSRPELGLAIDFINVKRLM